ncbi:HPr-rel-A system PqqD family peptide chaperone [Candidatus Nitrotoga sp. 1052]|uniref:HPr-rel-A system PqqD family peptide chaperone n=1 Tax=Candidatus Nitrotoga sp. 1052 TaxID=2886964 RepID=UPI001EF57951|nr:HPr-rel-A system PqqD family peptide chaperone [Candidatus Nitrotoga sp. 1052]CAH1084923.1 PqqD family protein, HPr-rel-A system [Candidatus Nitrotoga sp. 1052]
MKWQVISDQAVNCCSWDDELVFYNKLSGDTHLLGSAAAQVLLELRQSPLNALLLTEALAPRLQADNIMHEEFSFQIEHLLNELNTLGLIEFS